MPAGPKIGKQSKLTRNDLLNYFARERLQINERASCTQQ